ncbi:non-ribosomal peptide synthetase [Streptomyces violaceusniger]|nr:non-ribosomal peptide synthetase [Streptomyces violaceusniger]
MSCNAGGFTGLTSWNDTARPFPDDRCIHDLFDEQAKRTPYATALTSSTDDMTYRGLWQASNRLAIRLRKVGVGPDVPVGICAERGIELVIGLLGILKAGAAYVPLDPDYPDQRLQYVLDDTACPVIVAQHGTFERIKGRAGSAQVVVIGEDEVLQQPTHAVERTAGPDDLAYIIYTSGSTGAPKGVCLQHRGVVNRLTWMQRTFGLGTDDVVLQKTPFSFDVSVWEIFWPLMTGARLVLAQPGGHRDPSYLVDVIAQEKVSTLHFVPSMLSEFLDTPSLAQTRSLRRVICSGEVLPAALMNRACDLLTGTLHNLYGPTEASIDVSSYACQPDPAALDVPIGGPIDNTQLYVLDNNLDSVPCGETGHLYISGVQLARGYYKKPGLTAEKFIPNPFGKGRLYHTGDLARWREDGLLDFLGRADRQVKIRGQRVELEEIEETLLKVTGVRDAAVVLAEVPSGHRQLVAHIVPFQGHVLDPQQVKSSLNEFFPAHMVPSRIVLQGRFPLTASGKVDRQALLALSAFPDRPQIRTAASTKTEASLIDIWQSVLCIEVGTDEDFFDLGGDSLQAMRITARARSRGLNLCVSDIFKQRTIQRLADTVGELTLRESPSPEAINLHLTDAGVVAQLRTTYTDFEEAYALSPLQVGMLFHSLFTTGSTDYFEQAIFTLAGHIETRAFESAWRQIAERHPALRTTVHWQDVPRPLQLVHRDVDIDIVWLDWRNLDDNAMESARADLLAQDKARGFQLDARPPIRLTIMRTSASEAEVLLSFHHIILDGWSLSIIVREIVEIYAATLAARPGRLGTPPPFRRYIQWIARDDEAATRAHWCNALSGFTAPTQLPGDDPSAGPGENEELTVSIAGERAVALRASCRSEGITLSTIVHASWGLLLARYSGDRDVVFGSTVSGRPANLPGIESIVGMFINTLPIRVRVPSDTPIGDWLRGIQQNLLTALDHADAALADIHRWSGIPSGQSLFSSIVISQNHPVVAAGSPQDGARLQLQAMYEQTGYPLVLVIDEEEETIHLTLRYQRGRLQPAGMRKVSRHLVQVLTALASNPSRTVATVGLLTPTEQAEIVGSWNETSTDWDNDFTIAQLIEQQAAKTPTHTALTFGEVSLSYQELDQRANQLAHYLRSLGAGSGQLVGVLYERSLEMVITLLAVMKTGAGYVPLAPDNPAERLQYVLRDAQIELLVAQERLMERLDLSQVRACVTETDFARIAQHLRTQPERTIGPDDLAYVIYTSGSTGRPKGVACHHRGLVNYLRSCMKNYAYRGTNGAPLFSSFGFDMIVPNLYTPLLMGQPVHLIPEGLNPGELAERLVEKSPYAFIKMTPGHLDLLAKQLTKAQAHNLAGLLAVGADAFSPHTLASWRTLDPDTPVLNEYGPTEASVANTFYDTAEDREDNRGELLPIGYPIKNTTLYVLDDDLNPLPAGVHGEVYIGGVCCARGYLNKPALTAERFIPDPFTKALGSRMYRTGDIGYWLPGGNLQFVGRSDQQVKIRGHRIELGEVEHCLDQHPKVRKVIVLGVADETAFQRLVCYYTLRETGKYIPDDELHRWASATLPSYMVPSVYIAIEEIPLDANGKVNRKALPTLTTRIRDVNTKVIEPRNTVEEDLCTIWREALQIDHIGVHDNFFQLGGDSILTVQVCARARRQGVPLTPKHIFDHPTIASLAAEVGPERTEAVPVQHVSTSATESLPLLPIQRWFFAQKMHDWHHYNQSSHLEADNVDPAALEGALHDVVQRHDALRLTFKQTGGFWNQSVAQTESTGILTVIDVEDGEYSEVTVHNVATRIQSSLDPLVGRLLAAGLFRFGRRHPDRILLAVHHLAVDTLSWQTLLADLSTAYQARVGERVLVDDEPALPFTPWAHWVHRYARSAAVAAQEEHWRAITDGAERVPHDYGSGDQSIGADGATIVRKLNVDQTRRLLREVPSVFRIRVKEILATALCLTLNEWADGSIRVDLENHGRDPLAAGLDISRCIGWFTTIQPVRIQHQNLGASNFGSALSDVKERLRKFPDEGLGFSTRWLASLAEEDNCSAQSVADVVLNYHGVQDRFSPGDGVFKVLKSCLGEEKPPSQLRPYTFEVEAEVRNGELVAKWGYSRTMHSEKTVRILVDAFLRRIEELAQYCLNNPGGYTPSDFPVADLAQREIDYVSSGIADIEDIYSLAPMQQGMLFQTLLAAQENVYMEQQVYRAPGTDALCLEKAFRDVAERHAALRTTFAWRKLSVPVQIVHRHALLDVRHQDLRLLAEEEKTTAWEVILQQDLAEGFALSQSPPIRISLVHTQETELYAVLSFHHILMDRWSMAVFLEEVQAAYESLVRNERAAFAPAIPYRRFVEWVRKQDSLTAESFWRRELADLPRTAKIPALRESGTQSGAASLEVELGVELGERLATFCTDTGVTAATVAQGAWALVLARVEGSDDVIFGSTVAGRPVDLTGSESMVGLFINTIPSRIKVDRHSAVTPWLRDIQSKHAAAREYSYNSLTDIHGWSNVPRGEPLFESLLVIESHSIRSPKSENARFVETRSSENVGLPLTICLKEGELPRAQLLHDLGRCSRETALEILNEFFSALAGLLQYPGKTLLGSLLNHASLHEHD